MVAEVVGDAVGVVLVRAVLDAGYGLGASLDQLAHDVVRVLCVVVAALIVVLTSP